MNTKIVTRPVLKSILQDLRNQGKRIVFTNGCFDILHIGHLRYLQQARRLGDCLVVGINSDESVRLLKGPNRPFVPGSERAEMLAGFACVDYVVIFPEVTAINLISELKPHIYVKGGDYKSTDQIPEADTVRAINGEIVILQKVEGKSTTNLASQIVTLSQIDTLRYVAPKRTVVGMIPARMAATRLPGKPLLDIAGKPMIQWVYEHAASSRILAEVIVATPDQEIRRCVEEFGGKSVITSPYHRTGTDRLAEAARNIEADIIVNIQGDEPMLGSATLDTLVQAMLDSPDAPMVSLMCLIANEQEEIDPAVVKVVVDQKGWALYFSRARIPFPRHPEAVAVRRHIGTYAYRREILLTLATLRPTPLEQAESLEQLRALEYGYRIKMVETKSAPISVDTIEDLQRVREIFTG